MSKQLGGGGGVVVCKIKITYITQKLEKITYSQLATRQILHDSIKSDCTKSCSFYFHL